MHSVSVRVPLLIVFEAQAFRSFLPRKKQLKVIVDMKLLRLIVSRPKPSDDNEIK